jgi:hypothetical protein
VCSNFDSCAILNSQAPKIFCLQNNVDFLGNSEVAFFLIHPVYKYGESHQISLVSLYKQLFWCILYSLYGLFISGWSYTVYTEFAYCKQFITFGKRYHLALSTIK